MTKENEKTIIPGWFITESHKEKCIPFKLIKERGELKPGFVFNAPYVEQLFGMEFSHNNWEFRGLYITLKNLIEAEGYFITQKNMDAPGFRILETREMAQYAKKKLLKNTLSNFKVGYVLSSHEGKEVLSDEQQKEMSSLQKAAARIALNQQSELLKLFDV